MSLISDIPLKRHRIPNYQVYLSHVQNMSKEYARYRVFETSSLPETPQPFTISGYSYPANEQVDFQVDYLYTANSRVHWRETVICPITHLNNRLRGSLHIFNLELKPDQHDIIYITEQTTPLYTFLQQRYPKLIGSEYLADEIPLGSSNVDGIRNEDLTQLTFADDSLDYILSFECLEHIPHYMQAFRECYRVIKTGGKMLLSVPFNRDTNWNIIRARMRFDGTLEHILTPEYHDDPINKNGTLCFTHFGWEMLDEIRLAGFSEAYAVLFWSAEYGYLGREPMLFIAVK